MLNLKKFREIIKDEDYYNFNKNFIFEYMEDIIKEHDINKGKIDFETVNTVNNLIKHDLYRLGMDELISWFLGSFGFFDAFRELLSKSEYLTEIKLHYGNFENDADIIEYSVHEDAFNKSLEMCFSNDFENLSV